MSQARNVVLALLDARPLRFKQWAIVAIATLALVMDGLDVHLLAFVTPSILSEWHVDKLTLAPALAAALAGMQFGAPLGGWAGDRWGRKTLVAASIFLFGFATMASSLASGPMMLTALRFISGIGFGAATPNAIALVTEWLPQRARTFGAGMISTGAAVGGLIGATVAVWLLPAYGWKGSFIFCGAATVGLGLVALAWLPESPAYLLDKGKQRKAARELKRIVGADLAPCFDGQTVDTTDTPVRTSIFSRDLLRHNIGAPLGYFAFAFMGNAMGSWIPTILTGAGLSIEDALTASLCYSTLAIGGALLASVILGRLGSKSVIIGGSMIALAVTFWIEILLATKAVASDPLAKSSLLAAIGILGGAIGGSVSALTTVMSLGYPTDRRSTGIGFAVTLGRCGGIAAILGGGALLSLTAGGAHLFFAMMSIAPLVAVGATFLMDRHISSIGKDRTKTLPSRWPVTTGRDKIEQEHFAK